MKILLVFFFIFASFCFARDPFISANITSSIAVAGSNYTVYGGNFESNYQNTSYCDWQGYGTYVAHYVSSTMVKCLVPSTASEQVVILKISNIINTPTSSYSVYSNPISVSVQNANNAIMLGSLSPYEPVSGETINITLTHGNFLTSDTTQNLCRFIDYNGYNYTTSLYYDSRTTGRCYAPYTKIKSLYLSVSANKGASWSNAVYFNFHQIFISSITPTSGNAGNVVSVFGTFATSRRYKYQCTFADYEYPYTNMTLYGTFISTSEIRCTVPTLSRTSYYRIYLSEDYGYHWSLFSSSYFHYTANQPVSQTPVVTSSLVYDLNTYTHTVSGYYFTPSTFCKLVTYSDYSPYTYAVNMTVTYSNAYSLFVTIYSTSLSSDKQYGIVCSNDGTRFSSRQSISFVPTISYLDTSYPSANQMVTIYGSGFSAGYTYCKISSTYSSSPTYFSPVVSTWGVARFNLPYLTDNKVYNIKCSNDKVTYSTSIATFTYYGHNSYNSFNVALWVPLIVGLSIFFILAFTVTCIAIRKNKRTQQQNQALVSPLENHQIELESLVNETENTQQQDNGNNNTVVNGNNGMNATVLSSPNYYPVQYVNQMPMFGYPQPVQYIQPNQMYVQPTQIQVYPNPPLQQQQQQQQFSLQSVYPLSHQNLVVPQPPLSQNFVVPQQPLSQNFLYDENDKN